MKALKYYGYKGRYFIRWFHLLWNYLKKKLGIDYVHANELEIIDGKLTGKYLGEMWMVKRSRVLRAIAEKEGIHINQTIAVGDGANDLPMLNLAVWELLFMPNQQ
jgi:phosphoserine phosphatase